MATSPDHARGNTDGAWLDLYQMLNVAPGSDTDTLRERIRAAYSEAIVNTDHRIIERRIHYQMMSERIIPQSRRILLNPELRARYDEQRALHQSGDPRAQSFAEFLAGAGGTIGKAASDGEIPEQEPMLNSASSGTDSGWPEPAMPFPDDDFADEDFADTESEDKGVEEAIAKYDTAEARADAQPEIPISAPEPPADKQLSESVSPPETEAPPTVATPAETPAEIPPKTGPVLEQAVQLEEAKEPQEPSPAALYASVLHADGPQMEAHSTALLNLSESATTAGARRRHNEKATRISVGESEISQRAVGSPAGRGKRILSHTTQLLAMGIVAALLTIYIMRSSLENDATRAPLRVAYASDMQPFLELAQKQFAETDAGKAITLELRPIDSRAAMGAILSGTMPADVWIPAESLWSDRFNQVAGSRKVRPISVARSIALSPTVLIVRSDHAAALHQRFPNGIISSWNALRDAVGKNAAAHFGLTDPSYSGAGAIARYFMAREWCRANHMAWNKSAASKPALWQWMSGFEDNVPASERLSADMTKELALGTGDRYWWAIGYESEAIAWLQKGKKLDVFYLPQTTYADHPLCVIERAGEKNDGSRSVFEAFLRGSAMQQALLQAGLRPTEIEIASDVKNNPFNDSNMRARGLKQSGFPTDSRINYGVLNALNAAWSARNG